MSSINHKGFTPPPLNTKKFETVGQTIGERRTKETLRSLQKTESWFQWAKDFFWGGKRPANVGQFKHPEDRFTASQRTYFSHHPIVEHKTRLEKGMSLQARVVHPPADQHVRFLDSILQYLNTPKKPQKA